MQEAPSTDTNPPASAQQVESVQPTAVRDSPTTLVGGVTDYMVRKGDTLKRIGARFGVDVATLARGNDLRRDARLTPGHVLRIDSRHIVPAALGSVELVVNIPQRMLFYRGANGSTVGYPVGVGRRDWPTPTGAFEVAVLERYPTWNVPASILAESRRKGRVQAAVVPPGPNNPLGEYWIGLSRSGIGIHATNAPMSIYGTVSHGCIRVHPDDISRVFGRISVGAKGRIIYQPTLLTVHGDTIYLEVHRDAYGRGGPTPRALAAAAGVTERVDWALADAVAAEHEGIARDVTLANTVTKPVLGTEAPQAP